MAFPNPFDLQHHRSGPDGDLVEQFLSTYGNRQTRRSYRSDLRQFLNEGVTRRAASRIQEEDITEFLRGRAGSLKRKTLKRKLETLRSFFRWLGEQGVIEELPICENQSTGDLVEQVLQDASGATGGETTGGKRTRHLEGGSPGTGQDSPEPLPGGLIPRELEPGSEVDTGREAVDQENETAPRPDKSRSASSRGGPSQKAEHEEKPGSGQSESSQSESSPSETFPRETSPSEILPSNTSKSDTSKSDTSKSKEPRPSGRGFVEA
jgi:hypothetical protein